MADEDDFERPRWKVWLLNRFVLTPAILLAILVSTCASMAVTAAVMSWASARWAGGAR